MLEGSFGSDSDEDSDFSLGGGGASSHSSAEGDAQSGAVLHPPKNPLVGSEHQVDLSGPRAIHAPCSTRGHLVWNGAHFADELSSDQQRDVHEWMQEVVMWTGAKATERVRVREHLMKILHCWDYDLDGVKNNFDRIVALAPIPAVGEERWSQDEMAYLKQLQQKYPFNWEEVAMSSLHKTKDDLAVAVVPEVVIPGSRKWFVTKRRKLLEEIAQHNSNIE